MSYLLIQDEPLLVSKKLATYIGLNESIFLQQLHYWVTKTTFTADGCKWIYNTYEAWQVQFPFWSISTIRRIIDNLEKKGLIRTSNFNKQKRDQTKWYAIQYEELNALENVPSEPSTVEELIPVADSDNSSCSNWTDEDVNLNKDAAQFEQVSCSVWTDESPNLDKPLPKITSKISTKNISKTSSKIKIDDNEERANVTKKNPFHFFEENGFGTIDGFISEKINAWCTDLSDNLVTMAMELAVEHGCKSWKYVEAILRDWVDKGYQTREDVYAAQMSFKEKKYKQSHSPFDDEMVKKLQHENDGSGKEAPEKEIDVDKLRSELERDLIKYQK